MQIQSAPIIHPTLSELMCLCIRVYTYTLIHVVMFIRKQVHTFTLIPISTCTCGRKYIYTIKTPPEDDSPDGASEPFIINTRMCN